MTKICVVCHKVFEKTRNTPMSHWLTKRKYCSTECRTNDPAWRANLVAKNTGKKHSPETLAKIKVVNATKAKRGSESHLWKGGIDSDPLHRLERQRRWYRENPGRAKLIGQKRRALKRGGGPLSLKTVQMVYEDNIKRFGTLTCIYCLDPISFGSDELEHRMPLARGGTNEYGNLAVACHKCNATKRHKTEEEFVEWRLRRDK